MKLLTVLFALVLLFGCKDKKKTDTDIDRVSDGKSNYAKNISAEKLPEGLFVKKLDDAISIVEARKLKPGDKVTVKGKVKDGLWM